MASLQQIESDLVIALKAKNQLAADTLRGLKVRLQNEKIAKMAELTDEQTVALVKSEIKKRREAAEAFQKGNRAEQAEKELAEAKILEGYLPEQMSEQQIASAIDGVLSQNSFTAADFGKAMGAVKSKIGSNADGALVAKILKEKLK